MRKVGRREWGVRRGHRKEHPPKNVSPPSKIGHSSGSGALLLPFSPGCSGRFQHLPVDLIQLTFLATSTAHTTCSTGMLVGRSEVKELGHRWKDAP